MSDLFSRRGFLQTGAAVTATSALPRAPGETGAYSRFTTFATTSFHSPASIMIPDDFRPRESRIAIAADVLAEGKYLGQIAEAVIRFS